MPLNEVLLKRVADAISTGQPATPDDMLTMFEPEITMRSGYVGYANPRVTAMVDALSSTEVSHVKFIPLRDEGYVIMLGALNSDLGAVDFARGESRRTGTFNLRAALSPFDLDLSKHRKLKIPVMATTVTVDEVERPVLLLRIKRPATVKTQTRPRRKKPEETTPAQPVAVTPSAAKPGAASTAAAPPAAAPPAAAPPDAALESKPDA